MTKLPSNWHDLLFKNVSEAIEITYKILNQLRNLNSK